MATGLVKVNGTEVAFEESGKTVVNININQESSLSYLAKAVAAASQKWKSGRKQELPQKASGLSASSARPARAQCTGEQKVLGGTQILLGIMCLGLGGVLTAFNDFNPAIASGAPFWMGSLFIVSGLFCVLSERRGGCCWILLATFFNLASVVAASVGLAVGVAEGRYMRYTPYWVNDVCKKQRDYGSWRATQIPSRVWREDLNDDQLREVRCISRMKDLLNIFSGVQILLIIFSVAAMGIALFCLGYGLRVLCCSMRTKGEEYVATDNQEAPPSYEEPAKVKIAY